MGDFGVWAQVWSKGSCVGKVFWAKIRNVLYLDGSKIEAKANKYSWVWKKSCLTNRLKLFSRVTDLFKEINLNMLYPEVLPLNYRLKLFNRVTDLLKEINLNLLYPEGITFELREEYAIEYLEEKLNFLVKHYHINSSTFVNGRGHSKSLLQRYFELLSGYILKLKEYAKHIQIS